MIYSYCKRCNLESPGDTCTGCGKRAAVSAQMDQWSIAVNPLMDGRVWRAALIALSSAALLLMAVVFGMEAAVNGGEAASVLFRGSLPRMILVLVPVGMAVTLLFLLLQGQEVDVFKLDAQGAHLRTWHGPQKWKSWARLQSAGMDKAIPSRDGSRYVISEERHIRWKD